jgi:glucose-1-phosphate adenylyltransferase
MADRRGQPLARETMAYVLAGGRGARLAELTERRAKPAVYFGGKARIIDFALSNAINSGVRRIGVATQYKAHSLIRHLQRGWNFLRPERNESFDILPASQRVSETQWYEGTADAVFQNIDIIESYGPEYIIILAGDHIYKMDYELMLQQHCDQAADVTIACMEVPRETATGFGVMAADANGRVTDFVEKPADPPPMVGKPDMALVSMGIYVFDAYFEANIDLTDVVPELDLYDRSWPLWTYSEIVPPAKFVHDIDGRRGSAVSSLVSGDCIVSGSNIVRSLLFTGVRANSYSNLDEAVVLPQCQIGRGARLRRVVIDRGVVIPPGLVVGEDAALDAQRFRRTSNGVCLITQVMIDRLS